jgi:hypothetical protein
MPARQEQIAVSPRVVFLDQAHQLVEAAAWRRIALGQDEAAKLVHRGRVSGLVRQSGDFRREAHAGRLQWNGEGKAPTVSDTRCR